MSCTPSASGKCVPCESLDKSHLLSADQIEQDLSTMPLWSKNENGKLIRKYTAKNFQCAMDSLNEIGKIAERENHHPDLHLTSYRDVEIILYTHSLGGLTQNDIAVARMIDAEVDIVYSPKWLKSHPEAKKE